MSKDLTTSSHERQNILNNRYALQQAEQHLALGGVVFEGETVFTKAQVTALFDVADATIERYLLSHEEELKNNGYRVLRGAKLKSFKKIFSGTLINEGTKTSVLGIFSFRAVLNLGMLLTESDAARQLRTRLLDIVLDVMAERTGGQTKYINQRDENYLFSALQEDNYRRQFTDALRDYIEDNQWKYAHFTDLVYQSIFQENAKEYRSVLKLASKENIRDTLSSMSPIM